MVRNYCVMVRAGLIISLFMVVLVAAVVVFGF